MGFKESRPASPSGLAIVINAARVKRTSRTSIHPISSWVGLCRVCRPFSTGVTRVVTAFTPYSMTCKHNNF